MKFIEKPIEKQYVTFAEIKSGHAFRTMDGEYGVKIDESNALMLIADKKVGEVAHVEKVVSVQRMAIESITYRPWPVVAKSKEHTKITTMDLMNATNSHSQTH